MLQSCSVHFENENSLIIWGKWRRFYFIKFFVRPLLHVPYLASAVGFEEKGTLRNGLTKNFIKCNFPYLCHIINEIFIPSWFEQLGYTKLLSPFLKSLRKYLKLTLFYKVALAVLKIKFYNKMGQIRKFLFYEFFCQSAPCGILCFKRSVFWRERYLKECLYRKFHKIKLSSHCLFTQQNFNFWSIWESW